MSAESPWAPEAAAGHRPEDAPGTGPEEEPGSAASDGPDPATALGAAVVLLALAGICALVADHFLIGGLRLAAGLLTAAGLGVAVRAVTGSRLAPRPRRILCAALAVAVALALTVPAVLATRVPALADRASARIDALGAGDTVHSLPDPDAPVLVRRDDGSGQLLGAAGAQTIEAAPEDVLALSADGAYLVQVSDATTTVLAVGAAAAPDQRLPSTSLDGVPLALDGERIVLRHCEDDGCRLSGYDLTAPEQALWTLGDAAETRGIDPAAIDVPARPDQAPGLLDAVRATGVLPTVPLRFDPAQGWVQLDPRSGFPVGRILAPPDQECRIAVTGEPPRPQDPLQEVPLVLTACSGEDGALTATAFRAGEPLWQSEASPGGDWSVRLDQGRVIATGTETGTDTSGEIVASEQRAAWTAPGADGVAQASAFTARVGLDGGRMLVANEAGQLVAYDTADGIDTWTLPLSSPEATVRGRLAAGTAVVLDPVVREAPLEPRGAQRLRVIDAADGEVLVETDVAEEVDAVHPVGGGRALVTVGEQSLLLGP